MYNIKAIISDIDGTILDTNHQIDTQLPPLIPMLQEKQIPFILASARSPLGMKDIYDTLSLDSPLICYNGALIGSFTKEQDFVPLFGCPLETTDLELLLETIPTTFPTVSLNIYSNEQWYVPKVDAWNQIESEITNIAPSICNTLNSLTCVHKILLIDDVSTIQKVLTHLETLSLPNTSFYLSKDNYLEIVHHQVSKEMAIQQIEKLLDITKDTILTIGDNYNDVPMLRYAKYGIAMGNAPKAVQESAFATTTANTNHGVSNAILKYILC